MNEENKNTKRTEKERKKERNKNSTVSLCVVYKIIKQRTNMM